jgi:hypothetical protein
MDVSPPAIEGKVLPAFLLDAIGALAPELLESHLAVGKIAEFLETDLTDLSELRDALQLLKKNATDEDLDNLSIMIDGIRIAMYEQKLASYAETLHFFEIHKEEFKDRIPEVFPTKTEEDEPKRNFFNHAPDRRPHRRRH